MAIDEQRRLELADAAKRALGDAAGITLMELLPPVGWADVARKDDLELLRREVVGEIQALRDEMHHRFEALELRLEARFERGFRQILVTVMSLMITGFIATIVANLAA
jgi:hypothetical protein